MNNNAVAEQVLSANEANKENYRLLLQKIGIFLVILTVVEIGVILFFLGNYEVEYESRYHIFTLIFGVLIYRGGLTASRVLVWLVTYSLVYSLSYILIHLFVAYTNDFNFHFETHSLNSQWGLISWFVSIAICASLYFLLRQPSILEARRKAGLTNRPPVTAVAIALYVVFAAAPATFLNSGIALAERLENPNEINLATLPLEENEIYKTLFLSNVYNYENPESVEIRHYKQTLTHASAYYYYPKSKFWFDKPAQYRVCELSEDENGKIACTTTRAINSWKISFVLLNATPKFMTSDLQEGKS